MEKSKGGRYGVLVGEGRAVSICSQASLLEKLTTESKDLMEVRDGAMRTSWRRAIIKFQRLE